MRTYDNLVLATLSTGPAFGRCHTKDAFPDAVALSGAAIHHITLLVIDGVGDRHDFSPLMLNDEHLAVLQLPDENIGAVARRARAHDGDDGVSQETDPDRVSPLYRDGTAFPGPFKTHHEPLHETFCGYVDATMICPRL